MKSARLDYLVDGKSAAQSTLKFVEAAGDERSAVQWWISDIPDESTAGVYSIYGAEGLEFGLSYGAELPGRIPCGADRRHEALGAAPARENALRQQQRRRRERRTGNAHHPHKRLIRSGNAARGRRSFLRRSRQSVQETRRSRPKF